MSKQPPNSPLHGLNVLVTRPIHQAQNLYEKITALGGRCTLFPTITIVPITPSAANTTHVHNALHTADKIIFVSSNAVTSVMSDWPSEFSAKQIGASKQIFAIGASTAHTLLQHNIHANIPTSGRFHSEGLLALPQMQGVKGEHIVILKGEGGRILLADTLEARGAYVTQIEVYRRQLASSDVIPILQQCQKTPLDFVISTSCESLENLYLLFATQGKDWLLQQRLLLVSQRVQLRAEQLGFQHTVVAANATDDAIVEALRCCVC